MVREKEHAVVTEAGKRADLGWESRGWKFTQEELMNPPSLRDNISMEEEKVLRKKSQVFVFDCCKVLQTKSLVMCAAMTICQRYFSQVSFRKINRVDAAAAAIFLAAKVEEFRVHINSVLIVTHQVRHGSSRKLDPASREFKDYRERLLKAENQLVNALGFDFMIEHPYSHSTDLMQYMIKEGWVPTDRVPLLMKGACHLLNQSLRGTMCLEYAPFFRSRLAVYLSLLCNYVKVPESSATWAEALQFEDHRKLNRACCQLVETLDDDAGKTGKKLTKNRVVDALIVAGHIKSNKPRAPPLRTYDDFQRAGVRVRPPSPPSGHNKSKTKLPVSPDSELRRRVMAEIPELTDSPEEVDVFGNSSRPAPEVTQAMIKAGFSRRDDRVGSGSGGGGGGGGGSGSGYTSGGYASSSSNGKPKPKPPSGPAPPHAQRANGKASSAPHLGKRQRADERSPDGRAPRPRPPPPPQPRAPHTKHSSDHHHPHSSKSKSSSSSSSGKPRPPSTPKPPSSKSPGSGSGPRPPSSSKPRPPSTPYPKSSSLSSSSSSSKPRPPSTPYPKPPSSGSKPRPPSTPYPKPPSSGSKPRPPSTPCPNPKPSSSSTSKPPPPSGPRPPSTHKPRPPSTPAPSSAKPRPPSTPAPASAKPRPPATPAPASAKVRPPPPPTPPTSSKPRPPSTPKPPSTGKPHSSKPRPPSTPKPPPVPRTSSSTTPRPPSTPMPASSSNSPSSAMKPPPPSTPRPPSMPKPGSNAAKTTPRPPSTPRPPTHPKPAMPADTPGSSARGSGEGEAAAGAASSSPNASSSKGKHLPRPPSKPHPSKVNGNGSGNGNGVGNAVAGGGGGGHSPNGKRPRDVGDDGGGTGGGDGHPSPPKRSREDVDGASVARASASVGEPGGGGGRGRENGNGVGAAFNGSTATPGGMMKKHAVHVPSGFPRQEARSSHEKRPRDEGVEGGGGGGDPGSGGKKSRVNGYGMEFDAGGGDLDSVSSTGSATSPRASVLEDGEVEDGEIPMAALGAVSAV